MPKMHKFLSKGMRKTAKERDEDERKVDEDDQEQLISVGTFSYLFHLFSRLFTHVFSVDNISSCSSSHPLDLLILEQNIEAQESSKKEEGKEEEKMRTNVKIYFYKRVF